MRYLIILFAFFTLSAPAHSEDCVILLHGLAKTKYSMAKLDRALTATGYTTVNYDYPSRSDSIKQLAKIHIKNALGACPDKTTVHFVTHSMGGILVRQYLQNRSIPNLGRVVMLGPPNQGSEVVDKLHDIPGFELVGGPASLELGTQENSASKRLGSADFELGIIAGSRSVNLVLSALLPGPDDGKVTITNTKLEGMKQHIVLPVTHPFMMSNAGVISQVKNFLARGRFMTKPD